MAAHTIEGTVRVEEYGIGGSDIFIGDTDVAAWAQKVIPYDQREHVRAVLMIEDQTFLEAQGRLWAMEGEGGYSSWTPGCGPSVEVYNGEGGGKDIADKLAEHEGCNAALSLEVIN